MYNLNIPAQGQCKRHLLVWAQVVDPAGRRGLGTGDSRSISEGRRRARRDVSVGRAVCSYGVQSGNGWIGSSALLLEGERLGGWQHTESWCQSLGQNKENLTEAPQVSVFSWYGLSCRSPVLLVLASTCPSNPFFQLADRTLLAYHDNGILSAHINLTIQYQSPPRTLLSTFDGEAWRQISRQPVYTTANPPCNHHMSHLLHRSTSPPLPAPCHSLCLCRSPITMLRIRYLRWKNRACLPPTGDTYKFKLLPTQMASQCQSPWAIASRKMRQQSKSAEEDFLSLNFGAVGGLDE